MLCIALASGVISLAASDFTLSWTHSVALTRWEERWQVSAQGLRPVDALVEGSGAGMEVPPHAQRVDGGWRYKVEMPWQREIHLAASGETPDGWRLCTTAGCQVIGADASAPIRLWSARDCTAP